MAQTAIGFILAVFGAFFNGSFPAWERITTEKTEPIVFNAIVGMGAFISSLIVPLLFGKGYVFNVAAMFGGVVFLCATLCTFIAIPKVGLGVACATWSCTSIFVSVLWGVLGPRQVRDSVEVPGMLVLTLFFLAAGALVIVGAEDIAKRIWRKPEVAPLDAPLESATKGAGDRAVGLLFSVLTGAFGGSVLVPMKLVPANVAGIKAVFSFGIGAGIMSIVTVLAFWKLFAKREGLPSVNGKTVAAGLLAGTTWNLGNICLIVCQGEPFSVPFGISTPIQQCGFFFAGLWGIFAFGEIKGRTVLVFWAGAAILFAGVILLGKYGPGA